MITIIRTRAIDNSIVEMNIEDNQLNKFINTGRWSVKDTTHADDKRKISNGDTPSTKSSGEAGKAKRQTRHQTRSKKTAREEIKCLMEG